MKHSKSRVIRYLLIALLACIFVIAAVKIIGQLSEERRARESFRALSETVRSAEAQPAGSEEKPAESDGTDPYLKKYSALHEMNGDFFGWIRIDGTPIDYPVMYTPDDPEHYLRRGFDGSYLYCGVPFVDGACAADGSFYLIHGHHMKNDTMFGTLPRYGSPAYRQEHRLIHFDTLFEQRTYEVIAAFKADLDEESTATFRYLDYTDLSDPERFAEFMEGVRAAALYDSGLTAEYGDELILLSTCSYHTENGRFAVLAKRIA